MSIANSFSTFLARIQPLESEIDAAKQHLATIKARLNTVFAISDFRVTGSYARETYIRGFSDVDLFGVFRKANFTRAGRLINSNTALANIQTELVARYRYTPIRKDNMAIAISFSDGRSVDVVPALFDSMYDFSGRKWPVFLIPDGAGGWMETCPDLYDAYIRQENRKSGGKLLYVAQLMKYWRECRSPRIPLSSFHIEMTLAQESVCTVGKNYASSVRDILRALVNRKCAAMQNPFEIGGMIPAVKTAAQRERALLSIVSSRNRAHNAILAEQECDTPEARRLWRLVFGDRFPAS